MRMFRGILWVSWLEDTRNKELRRLLNLSPIDEIMRSGRLRWLGQGERCRPQIMKLALPGVRRRGAQERHRNSRSERTRRGRGHCGYGPRSQRVEETD